MEIFDAHPFVTDAQVDSRHAFAAVLSSKHAPQAASYLQRHLHKEMVRQLKVHHDDVLQTLRAALTALDQGFRHLHPFNSSILDSVDMATLWLDFASRTAYMGSKGQCQIVIGSTDDDDGSVKVCTHVLHSVHHCGERNGMCPFLEGRDGLAGMSVSPSFSYLCTSPLMGLCSHRLVAW